MYEIFKIQLPLNTTGNAVLVYNKNRSVEGFVTVGEVEHLFKLGEVKVYALGGYTKGEGFKFKNVTVKNPGW
jgi:hypothetical protein